MHGETVVNHQAGATEQRILHLETADPQRTLTFTPCYYSPDIDITWSAFAGTAWQPAELDQPAERRKEFVRPRHPTLI